MKRTVGIGISLVLALSLAVAAYVVYNSQTAGRHPLADLEFLATKSDLVVMGKVKCSETLTKLATDTSQPAELREDYPIELNRITFTVDEYLKGPGGDTVTITTQARNDPRGSENRLDEGTKYVVFLFDPSLLTDDDFWGDIYLTQGPRGIWQVSGSEAERRFRPTVLTLDRLRSEISDASGQ